MDSNPMYGDECSPNKWTCRSCTFLNTAGRPGCEMCGNAAPASEVNKNVDYWSKIDKERQSEFLAQEKNRQEIFMEDIRKADDMNIVNPDRPFDCQVCMEEEVASHLGVRLRQCLHDICKECLISLAKHDEAGEMKCAECGVDIDYRDVQNVVDEKTWEKCMERSRRKGVAGLQNKVYCMKADCEGVVEISDGWRGKVIFICPQCQELTCHGCRAIHTKLTCTAYQRKMKTANVTEKENYDMTQNYLRSLRERGAIMNCPACKAWVEKTPGCDWMVCCACKTEICWATKGRRWGPDGKGDISGGCRCGVDKKKCHPSCNNCH